MADALGIERRWFQGDHYDIPEAHRARAIALGATPVTSRELIRRLIDSGLRHRNRPPTAPPTPSGLPEVDG